MDKGIFYRVVTAFDTIGRANLELERQSPFKFLLLEDLAWHLSGVGSEFKEQEGQGTVAVYFDYLTRVLSIEYSASDSERYYIHSELVDGICYINVSNGFGRLIYTIRNPSFGQASERDILQRFEVYRYGAEDNLVALGYLDLFQGYATIGVDAEDFLAVVNLFDEDVSIMFAQNLLEGQLDEFIYKYEYFEKLSDVMQMLFSPSCSKSIKKMACLVLN